MLKTQLAYYAGEIRNVANKGFFHLFTAQGIVFVVAFLSQFFVAGFLEPTDMGRIKIMQTYLNLFAFFCGLGFDHSLLKLASGNKSQEEKKKLYQIVFLLTSVSFVVIYLLLYLLTVLGLISSDQVINRVFPMYILFLLPMAIERNQLAYYQAQKKVKQLAKLQVIIKAVTIVFIVGSTYLFKLNGYIVTVVITGFLTIAILESGIKTASLRLRDLKPNWVLAKSMWHMASYALITNLLGMLSYTIDVYLINYMITDREEVGYYMFALTIISVLQLVPTTVQQVAFPFFSEQSSNFNRWYSSYVKYNKLNHLLIIGIAAAAILIFPVVIKFAFAGKYDRSIHYFIFLAFAWMIKFSNLMKATAVMGQGRFDINFRAAAVSVALTIPVVFLSIYLAGLNGALVGMTLAAVVSYIAYTVVFHRFQKKIRPAVNDM